MNCIYYNDATFRALFPAYANTTTYPQATLQGYWNSATCYISDKAGGCYYGGLSLKEQTNACNLMTAHIAYIMGLIAAGQTPYIATAAGIDKISLTLAPPPIKNQWQYWLNTSPYGQQLLALLDVAGVGGFYVSTSPPGRAGFGFGGVW
jgi:hypothetical protein